jgi:hypothetical protein
MKFTLNLERYNDLLDLANDIRYPLTQMAKLFIFPGRLIVETLNNFVRSEYTNDEIKMLDSLLRKFHSTVGSALFPNVRGLEFIMTDDTRCISQIMLNDLYDICDGIKVEHEYNHEQIKELIELIYIILKGQPTMEQV